MSRTEQIQNISYATQIETSICQEIPYTDNPYSTEKAFFYGYEYNDILQSSSLTQVIYLLFKGEVPSKKQETLLEKWMVSCINSGPRHPASHAGMSVGIGKTNIVNILPVIMTILGGDYQGSGAVKKSIRFIQKNMKLEPEKIARELYQDNQEEFKKMNNDIHIAPGFGTTFNQIDKLNQDAGNYLANLDGAGSALKWGQRFSNALEKYGMSWLEPGLAAAVFLDLEFDEFSAMCFFQLAKSIGVLPYALEKIGKPITSMPFISDEHYFIEEEA